MSFAHGLSTFMRIESLAVDITDDPVTQAWKTKYLAIGLPESLLNQFITESNNEYNSVIGYGDINRMAALTVIINDIDETPNCYYVIWIAISDEQTTGKATTETSYIFSQVPCVSLLIYVIKIREDLSEAVAMGIQQLNHSKDESVTVTINTATLGLPVIQLPPTRSGIMTIPNNQGFISPQITESVQVTVT